MEEYRDMFLAEARDYLQGMTEHLLEMEKDPGNTEYLVEIFRSAHSLKGMSGTMGYEIIAGLTHKMETLLDLLRSGEMALETELVNLLFEAVDMVQTLVDNLDNQENYQSEVQVLESKLLAWQEMDGAAEAAATAGAAQPVEKKEGTGAPDTAEEETIQQPAAATPTSETTPSPTEMIVDMEHYNDYEQEMLKDAVSRGESLYHLHVQLLEGSLLKSVRAYMVCRTVEEQGEIIKTTPSMAELEEGQFEFDFSIVMAGKIDPAEMQHTLESIAEIEKVDVTPLKLEGFGEVAAEPPPVSPQPQGSATAEATEVAPQPEKTVAGAVKTKELKKPGTPATARPAEKTVRVETVKLDVLINLVGELIINRTRVLELGKQTGDELLEGSLEQLERVTTDLQGAAMSLRMVPIKQVFDRFPRMVRDLAVSKGKDVELAVSGAETELDRSIVNQVGDPLVHLLRNAVDHGIETPEERTAKGKNPAGNITLEAHHEGSHVVVSVSDDGKGIDPQIIRAKALEKGVATSEELDAMDDDEAVNLVFRSGFSTSKEVTDVSGRGVGMDVVKSAVEALSGKVEVKTELGQGSRFVLRLPLTLAIIRTLMVKGGDEIYAIPVEAIRENIYIEEQDIKTVNQDRVITLRDDILTLYSLTERLGMGSFINRDEYSVVVVEAGNKKAGLIVDELLGQQEIVIKSLSSFIKDSKGIAGATVLGNGRVALILDVATLIDEGAF